MKMFHAFLLFGVLFISTDAQNKPLRKRELSFVHTESSGMGFDYFGIPSASATNKCALINVLVNETSTREQQHIWLKDSDIPSRVARYYDSGYDKVFVCGNGCGASVDNPSSTYRHMGCTAADAYGVLANDAVVDWTNRTGDSTMDAPLAIKVYFAIEQTMASLPSSIEGMDLLDTCHQLDKHLVYVTNMYEELLDQALTESGIKSDISNKGYVLDAISYWTDTSLIGTYVGN